MILDKTANENIFELKLSIKHNSLSFGLIAGFQKDTEKWLSMKPLTRKIFYCVFELLLV